MLWTIEEGHKLWQLECKNARDSKITEPEQPDISKAWRILDEDQKPTFQKRRARLYLDSESEMDVADSERLFKGLITYAAQVGLMLAWASLHAKAAPALNPSDLAEAVAKAINATLSSGPKASRDRRRILLKKSDVKGFQPLNSLPKLEPVFASQYRYFWLELALAKEGRVYLEEIGVKLDEADALLKDSFTAYLLLLIEDRKRLRMRDTDIRKLSQAEQKVKAGAIAKTEITEEQAKARKYWFGEPIEDARNLINGLLAPQVVSTSVLAGSIDPEEEEEDIEENEEDDGI
jgi:hypothetical protein